MPLSTWSLPAVPWGRVTQLFSCFYPRCPFLSLSKSDSAWDDTHQTMLLPTWPACMSSQPMDVSWFWIEKHNGFQPAAAAALEQYGQPWVFAASHGGHQTPHLQLQLVPGRMGQWGCKPGWGTTPACMLSDCHFVGAELKVQPFFSDLQMPLRAQRPGTPMFCSGLQWWQPRQCLHGENPGQLEHVPCISISWWIYLPRLEEESGIPEVLERGCHEVEFPWGSSSRETCSCTASLALRWNDQVIVQNADSVSNKASSRMLKSLGNGAVLSFWVWNTRASHTYCSANSCLVTWKETKFSLHKTLSDLVSK